MPYWKMNMASGATTCPIMALSDVYNGALEYNYLSEITKDDQFKERKDKIRKLLKEREKPRGVYMRRVNVETGQFWGTQAQLFRDTKDFYFTLVKEVYQSNFEDSEAYDMYLEAMDNVLKPSSPVLCTSRSGLNYVQGYDPTTKKDEKSMEYEACYLGGMWSMAVHMMERMPKLNCEDQDQFWGNMDRINVQSQLAKNIAATTMKAHSVTQTKLAPRKFCFNATMEATNGYWGPYDKQFHLR